ncbi:hypothetical protein CISIN_1g042602mg [Citrus sinensis]|uniref:DUF4371 domain-containing protein n=1 Tax=Citrus sinensis TaxID=2711 RepID=A0A067G356_CITSI|nr:hypothetical protein CISIN_1g042602mg [Citrus sinensis]
MVKWSNLKDPYRHIDKRMNAQSSQQILENKLRLKTLIISTKWLAKQACAFRGYDKLVNSLNRGKFIELIKLLATMNKEINKIVLENAHKNAQYIALKIQKELLNILANKEIRDTKFCILVDEALDESHKEECFFEVVNVDDTKTSLLKNEICNVLARYNPLIENLRATTERAFSVMSLIKTSLRIRSTLKSRVRPWALPKQGNKRSSKKTKLDSTAKAKEKVNSKMDAK